MVFNGIIEIKLISISKQFASAGANTACVIKLRIVTGIVIVTSFIIVGSNV